MKQEFEYVANKLDLSVEEFQKIFEGENKSFKDGDQLLVRGIINNPPDFDYSNFEIGLNSQVGAKNHLFDFTEHKDSRPDRKVWITKWNPHN